MGTSSGDIGTEVAAEHGRVIHLSKAGALRDALSGSLISGEEMELISEYWPPHRTAKDILVEGADGRGERAVAIGFLQEVLRAEKGIAVELENIAVELVGSRLDCGTDDTAGVAIILGVERAIQQVELTDSVQVRRKNDVVQRCV